MKLPLEIVAKGFVLSKSAKDDIRSEAEKLDLFYGRIMRCRVTVEGPGAHHAQGRWQVRIDLTVPGSEITVSRQRGEKLVDAIRESFGAATRRIEDYVRRTRRLVKSASKPARGTVTQLFPERGFGFLADEGGREIYFHRNSILGTRFDHLKPGASVLFAEELGEEGPQASTVRPAHQRVRSARAAFRRRAGT